MKVLKAIVLLGLIYGVLYFGLKFFFSSRGTPLSDEARKAVKELEILRDELAVFELKIHDLQRSGKPFDEEEEAIEGLKQKIQALKQRIAADAPAQSPGETAPPPAETGAAGAPAAPGKAAEPAAPSPPARGLFADTYQRVFVGAIVLFVLLMIALSVYRRRQRPVEPEAETGRVPRPRPSPKQTSVPGDLDLSKTFERFQAEAPQVSASKTTQFNLETIKSHSVEKPSVVDQIEIAPAPPPEPSQPSVPSQQAPPAPPPQPVVPLPEPAPPSEPLQQPPLPPPSELPQETPLPPAPGPSQPSGPVSGKVIEGSDTVKQVFELHDQGMNVEQISEQLHVDQDQVRLMLRFKQ